MLPPLQNWNIKNICAQKFSPADVVSNGQKLNPEVIQLVKKHCASLQHPLQMSIFKGKKILTGKWVH
jgi:hypothetical protein